MAKGISYDTQSQLFAGALGGPASRMAKNLTVAEKNQMFDCRWNSGIKC